MIMCKLWWFVVIYFINLIFSIIYVPTYLVKTLKFSIQTCIRTISYYSFDNIIKTYYQFENLDCPSSRHFGFSEHTLKFFSNLAAKGYDRWWLLWVHFSKWSFIQRSKRRYYVPLPYFQEQLSLQFEGIQVRRTALWRFEHSERKVSQDEALSIVYRQFMVKYEYLGHISVAQEPSSLIIPHHAVCIRSNDDNIKKLHVVFYTSACCQTCYSSNNTLYSVLKLHRDIIDVLLGFRLYWFVSSTLIFKIN